MPRTFDRTVLEDEMAMSLASAMAAANDKARQAGIDPHESLVTAAEHDGPDGPWWRFNYGPRDYVRRRGGDLIVDVGVKDGRVRRVLRGQ